AARAGLPQGAPPSPPPPPWPQRLLRTGAVPSRTTAERVCACLDTWISPSSLVVKFLADSWSYIPPQFLSMGWGISNHVRGGGPLEGLRRRPQDANISSRSGRIRIHRTASKPV